MLFFQLKEFHSCLQDTSSWLAELQCQVDSLNSQSDAEERLHSAQVRRRLKHPALPLSVLMLSVCKENDSKRKYWCSCIFDLKKINTPLNLDLLQVSNVMLGLFFNYALNLCLLS